MNDDVIAKYLSNELFEEERKNFESWLEKSPTNKKQFLHSQKVLEATIPLRTPSLNIENEWEILEKRLHIQTPAHWYSSKNLFSWYGITAFATLFVAIGIGIFILTSSPLQEYATNFGEQKNITLPDGSTVQLNSASSVQFKKEFSDSVRWITLNGEAFFQVEHNGKPFIVQTPTAIVQVVGTEFNVWAREEKTRLIVQQGRVQFFAKVSAKEKTQSYFVSAGETSECKKDESPTKPTAISENQYPQWFNGKLVFYQTPLKELTQELEYTFAKPIHIENPELQNKTITGTFTTNSLDSIVSSLCLTLHMHNVVRNDTIVVF